MLESTDAVAHEKAEKVIKMFRDFKFPHEDGAGKWLPHAFKAIKVAVSALTGNIIEPAEEIFELSGMLFKLFGRNPILALEEFGAQKADPKKLDAYLQKKFGDKFNLGEMHIIATLLAFPETAADWRREAVTFEAMPSRADSSTQLMGRPYHSFSKKPAGTGLNPAELAIDEMLKKSVPYQLIDELIKSGVPREKIDQAMKTDNPRKELEVLREKNPK